MRNVDLPRMISRSTAKTVADAYEDIFTYNGRSGFTVSHGRFYDFLYEHGYEAWFCNIVKSLYSQRSVKEFIMKLHTGETQYAATPNWTSEQRQKLGQHYLQNLGKDLISHFEQEILQAQTSGDRWRLSQVPDFEKTKTTIIRKFELDGFVYRDAQLLKNEADVLDVAEEQGVVLSLATTLGLNKLDIVKQSLELSETHYLESRWADSIANSRKALECLLSEAAGRFAERRGIIFPNEQKQRPVEVRSFLKDKGLLEEKEKEALAKIYGLLSHTGSHPYMAEKDQARLLRQLSLTLGQFVLLRVEGALR